MYRPTSLTKWDISLSSLIIRCCPALQIPPLSSTCNICSYCRFLAAAPHLVFMAMLRFHVWLLVHTSSYSRRRVNGNLFIIIWQWWLPRNVTLSWPHFSTADRAEKKLQLSLRVESPACWCCSWHPSMCNDSNVASQDFKKTLVFIWGYHCTGLWM